MPYLEAKFSLYIAGEGPYPMVYHRETSETDPIGNVFVAVAEALDGLVPGGPEQTVALRKLLESKDAAVRAVKYPGN